MAFNYALNLHRGRFRNGPAIFVRNIEVSEFILCGVTVCLIKGVDMTAIPSTKSEEETHLENNNKNCGKRRSIKFPMKDLDILIDYSHDERRHFLEGLDYDGVNIDELEDNESKCEAFARRRTDHIYCSVARLKYWLENQNGQ